MLIARIPLTLSLSLFLSLPLTLSLSLSLYMPLLLSGPLDNIQCQHIADECKSLLIVQHWCVHLCVHL